MTVGNFGYRVPVAEPSPFADAGTIACVELKDKITGAWSSNSNIDLVTVELLTVPVVDGKYRGRLAIAEAGGGNLESPTGMGRGRSWCHRP